jgi:hypothetical protein
MSIFIAIMLLYFEFEERRVKAEVTWPKNRGTITVHIIDRQIVEELPPDLLFDVDEGNKVGYTIESPDDKRLIELQSVIARRLQELVSKS